MRVSIAGADQLKVAAEAIRRAPKLAAAAGIVATNQVASRIITTVSRDITERYNLKASYVRSLFRMTPARDAAGAMVIARRRGINLVNFSANQMTAPARSGLRAKGDKLRSIAPGRKQAGVSVNVVRQNGRKTLTDAFLLPRMAGSVAGGNGLGVVMRDGSNNKIRGLQGPTPAGAFSFWIKAKKPEVQRMLAEAWAAEIKRQMRGKRQ